MTQEEKELLRKDLLARLSYCPIVHVDKNPFKDNLMDIELKPSPYSLLLINNCNEIGLKPYLRPMSSMTKEERTKIAALSNFNGLTKSAEFAECSSVVVDYCNSRHLDYRGLIPMGLALEAPDGMYKIE